MYRWVYSLVHLGTSPFHQLNIVYAKYTYSQIKYVRLRAIQICGQECQTHHWQHNSINIRVKFETKELALVIILPDIWGGRCLLGVTLLKVSHRLTRATGSSSLYQCMEIILFPVLLKTKTTIEMKTTFGTNYQTYYILNRGRQQHRENKIIKKLE